MKRPPVVVVMGHVDHGKTSLLDYIRKTTIADSEAGGITQSVGAYEIVHAQTDAERTQIDAEKSPRELASSQLESARKITFIDTPGHEAFSKMRARGANIADLAILVVAATDSVQNQTKEAIKVLTETQTPFIVAINKIDKASETDIDRVISALGEAGVLLEGRGGSVSWQGVSAKRGDGINELLDLILLTAEMEDLQYDPAAPAEGYVLESRLESRRGITATVIVKNGTLRVGNYISAGNISGKIKTLENFLGERVTELAPSSPAIIFGFEKLPEIGSEFKTGQTEFEAKMIERAKVNEARTVKKGEVIINLTLKADVGGSLEALSQIIKNIPHPPNFHIDISEESVGEVTDGDIKTAVAHRAAIVAFRSKPNKAALSLNQSQNVNIIQSEIIYDLVKAIEEIIKAGTVAKTLGTLLILAIFGKKGGAQMIGGRVTEGEIRNNSTLEIVRDEKKIGTGKVVNLQSQKRDAVRVEAGSECGLLFSSTVAIKENDQLIMR